MSTETRWPDDYKAAYERLPTEKAAELVAGFWHGGVDWAEIERVVHQLPRMDLDEWVHGPGALRLPSAIYAHFEAEWQRRQEKEPV